MNDKFGGKYRIRSTRLSYWDYGYNAAYFVTLCLQERQQYFGEVTDGKMVLSEIGEIACKCWIDIPNHFPFVKLDEFIIMPDHMHGIIIIDKPIVGNHHSNDIVETQDLASLPPDYVHQPNRFGPQCKNLASIVRGYKIGVSKDAHKIDPNFSWQSRYYDRVIRDNQSLNNIRDYIIDNPAKWDKSSIK